MIFLLEETMIPTFKNVLAADDNLNRSSWFAIT